MGAAYAKHKERRRKREARDALKAPRLPRLYFSRPHDATNVRGGVLSLVSDVEATAALAIPASNLAGIMRLWNAVKKVKTPRPDPKPSPDHLLMDMRRVTKLEKKYKKGPIVTVSMPAIAEKLFEGKRPMKRTPFTDRMWTLFAPDIPFEQGKLHRQHFVALVWNICALSQYGMVEYCVNMFDLEGRNGIERCELETLVRMLHGVREWNDVPGMEEAFKGLPTEADVLIPKRVLHQLVVREGGAVILKPAFELQASLRARARPITGCVDWEMLGHGRGKKVRTYAQVLRDAELGWTASCPSTQRVRAYLVKPHFTFAGQRGGVLAQLMRKVTSTPQDKYKAQESDSGSDEDSGSEVGVDDLPMEYDGQSGGSGSEGDADADADGDDDADADADGSQAGSVHSDGSDAEGNEHGGTGGGGDSNDDGGLSDGGESKGDDGGGGGGTVHTNTADADADAAPSTGEHAGAAGHTSSGVKFINVPSGAGPPRPNTAVSVLFDDSVGEPRRRPRPKSSIGTLKYPTVSLPVQHKFLAQGEDALELVRAWAANDVVRILAAAVNARFKYDIVELEDRWKQHHERRRRRHVRRQQTRVSYVTHSGETLMKDGEDLTSEEEEDSDQSSVEGSRRKGIMYMESMGSIHISDSDVSDDSDSDAEEAWQDGSERSDGGRNPAERAAAKRMKRQQSRMVLVDPQSLDDAIKAASTLSRKLTHLRLPDWAAPRWADEEEQVFLKSARRAATGWAIVERWRLEKREIPFMVRMRRELAAIRGDLHDAEMELEDEWESQYRKDVATAESRARRKADEKVKMNIAVIAQMKKDAKKLLWVKQRWNKVDNSKRKRNAPPFTKNMALEAVRKEFIEKETQGARNEVDRLYQQLRLQKRRLIRWLQDKAAELSQEDLAGVQDVMLADTQQLDRAVW